MRPTTAKVAHRSKARRHLCEVLRDQGLCSSLYQHRHNAHVLGNARDDLTRKADDDAVITWDIVRKTLGPRLRLQISRYGCHPFPSHGSRRLPKWMCGWRRAGPPSCFYTSSIFPGRAFVRTAWMASRTSDSRKLSMMGSRSGLSARIGQSTRCAAANSSGAT